MGLIGRLCFACYCNWTEQGYSAALFYLIAYGIMFITAFGLIILVDDFRGLNDHKPWLAFLMTLTMFAMVGMPPLVGFTAKLDILRILFAAHQQWLALYMVVFTVISAYYYLGIIRIMYFDTFKKRGLPKIKFIQNFIVNLTGLSVLFFGLLPTYIIQLL